MGMSDFPLEIMFNYADLIHEQRPNFHNFDIHAHQLWGEIEEVYGSCCEPTFQVNQNACFFCFSEEGYIPANYVEETTDQGLEAYE